MMTTITKLVLIIVGIVMFGAAVLFGGLFVNRRKTGKSGGIWMAITSGILAAGSIVLLIVVGNANVAEAFIAGGLKTFLIIAGVAMLALSVIGIVVSVLRAVANRHTQPFSTTWKQVVATSTAAVVFLTGTIGASALSVTPEKTLVADNSNSGSSDEKPDDTLSENTFKVNLSDYDVQLWLKGRFGDKFDLEQDVCLKWSNASMPSQAQARIAANQAASQRYVGKDSVGFTGAVDFPLDLALARYYGAAAVKTTNAEEEAKFLDDLRKEIYLEIMRNPVSADMWVQALTEAAKEPELEQITKLNDWLTKLKTFFDKAYNTKTGDVQGLSALFEAGVDNQLKLKKSYALDTARLVILLDQLSAEGIETGTSKLNWENGMCADANFARTILLDSKDAQEKLPYLALVKRYKSGNRALVLGINLFDQRAELIDLSVPQKPVEKVSTHSFRIDYVYADNGAEAAPSYKEALKTGETRSITSPTITGYTADKKVVTVTMADEDITVTVKYSKNEVKVVYGALTINYKEQGTGKVLHDPYKLNVEVGKTYAKASPTIAGYELVNPSQATVTGTMKDAKGVTVDVLYKKTETPPPVVAEYQLLIKYVDKETNKEIFGRHDQKYKTGETYNVSSPTKTGYTADKTVVKGTMAKAPVNVTVYYSRNPHKLTVKHLDEATGKELKTAHTETVLFGKPYEYKAPAIEGYEALRTKVSANAMPDRDVTETIFYRKTVTKSSYKILYLEYGTKKQVYEPKTGETTPGDTYTIVSPNYRGDYKLHAAGDAKVVFTAGTEPYEYTVYYDKIESKGWYAIHYRDTFGNPIRHDNGQRVDDESGEDLIGKTFKVYSPKLGEYELVNADDWCVSGTITAEGFEYTVYYRSTNKKDPFDSSAWNSGTPSGSNDANDGSGDFQPTKPTQTDYTGPDGGSSSGSSGSGSSGSSGSGSSGTTPPAAPPTDNINDDAEDTNLTGTTNDSGFLGTPG